jgi:glycosyltransferase involved in cell wall biosynthesis
MLTVLLATRNRAQILHRVLESYRCLQQPETGWKLVVVDNGSADGTAELIASFSDLLPLHSLCEPRVGKNFAINAGLELIEGDLVVFTDDDVFPYPDWLVELRKIADAQPEYSMFGGAIVPRWEVTPPHWIEWVELSPVYALTGPWMKEGPIAPFFIYGPNMSVRSNVFQSGMGFNTSIGPRGSSYPMGSETELILRLYRQGHKGWHVHSAVVEHFIRKEQLQKAWVMKRAIRFGRGEYRVSHAEAAPPAKMSMGIPKGLEDLVRKMIKEGLFMIAATAALKRAAAFRSHWRFNFLRGQAIEAWILTQEQRAQAKSAPPTA